MESASLAATAGLYTTKVTAFTKTGTGWEICLAANPRRWYVRFEVNNSPGSPVTVVPSPIQPNLAVGTTTNLPKDYKFRDAPSIVAGEFNVRCANGIIILIEECIFGRG